MSAGEMHCVRERDGRSEGGRVRKKEDREEKERRERRESARKREECNVTKTVTL